MHVICVGLCCYITSHVVFMYFYHSIVHSHVKCLFHWHWRKVPVKQFWKIWLTMTKLEACALFMACILYTDDQTNWIHLATFHSTARCHRRHQVYPHYYLAKEWSRTHLTDAWCTVNWNLAKIAYDTFFFDNGAENQICTYRSLFYR